jgi:glycosyltransferase involved in cell wall biosynthesis
LKFDIAVPVYNEETSIVSQIRKLDQILDGLENQENQFRILIADNGSTDRTRHIAESLEMSMVRVSLISVGEKGVGLALRKAWEKSNAEVVGYMDLDLATDMSHMNEVINIFLRNESDVVNASRLLQNSIVRNRKVLRSISSRGLNLILKVLFKTKISDGMCGFKFMKRDALKSVIENGATSNGWFFATQLLLVAEMIGLKVREIPVTWVDDGNSKVKIMSLSTQYLCEIFELRNYIRKSSFRKYVRI